MRAANSVLPEPIGPITRIRLLDEMKSWCRAVAWMFSRGKPRLLRNSPVSSMLVIVFPGVSIHLKEMYELDAFATFGLMLGVPKRRYL